MERALVGELRAATAATEWSTQDKCERIVRAAALVAARKEPPMTWGPLLEAILDGAGIKSRPVIQPDGAELLRFHFPSALLRYSPGRARS